MGIVSRLIARNSLTLTAIVAVAAIWAANLLFHQEPLPRSLVRDAAASGMSAEELEARYGVEDSAIEIQ